MSKKSSIIMIMLIVVCCVATACYVEYNPLDNMHPQYGTTSASGTGTATGFGGTVTVTLKLTNGFIVEATVKGPGESAGYGAVAVANAGNIIVATNGVELETISGATVTTKAITDAGKAALATMGY